MSTQVEIVSAVYPDQEHAQSILDMLHEMHASSAITLKDAAFVSKLPDGKIHVQETKELTTAKGAKRGAIVAGIFGIIYPPSLIASVLLGGAIGAGWGKLRHTVKKRDSLKGVADGLQPGQVALVTLSDEASVPQIELALQGYEATPVRTQLNAEESAALQEASSEVAGA
jgi:uncharacterized membrane protein